jgi:phage baseplate assembly protein W
MADLLLEWADDLQIDETGDFATVSGSDELIERIIRRWLTNSQSLVLSTGTVSLIPDNVFEPTYGGNARAYVDAAITPELAGAIQNLLSSQLAKEPLVDTINSVVTVNYTVGQNALYVTAVVFLNTGVQIQLPALEISSSTT